MILQKVVLAGGTGFIGDLLTEHWYGAAVDVVILSRKPGSNRQNIRYIKWDGETLGEWAKELDGADVLINLSGKSVDCRYTERNRQLILASRVNSTIILGRAIAQATVPPRLWINSASATIYRHSVDRQMDEWGGKSGSTEPSFGFSEQVCQTWEKVFLRSEVPASVRKVALRMAIVLGSKGGVLPVLKKLVRLGLGGKLGSGNQYVSWLHEQDLVRIIEYVIHHDGLSGTLNASAPAPVRNRELMALLRQKLGVRIGMPATKWMLEIGAVFLRTETELVLKSRNVVPGKLVEAGFRFNFPTPGEAISDLIR